MIIWVPDVHLNATFHQLFTNDIKVYSKSMLGEAPSSEHIKLYDYLTEPVDWWLRKPVLDGEMWIYMYTRRIA